MSEYARTDLIVLGISGFGAACEAALRQIESDIKKGLESRWDSNPMIDVPAKTMMFDDQRIVSTANDLISPFYGIQTSYNYCAPSLGSEITDLEVFDMMIKDLKKIFGEFKFWPTLAIQEARAAIVRAA